MLLSLCGAGGLAGGVAAMLLARRGRRSRPSDVVNSYRLRLPKLTLWVGILCALFFALCLWSCLKLPGESDLPLWVAPCFLAFFLLGLYLILSYLNLRVWLYGDYLVLGSWLGTCTALRFSEVERVSCAYLRGAYLLHRGEQSFRLPMEMLGVRLVLAELSHAGARLPQRVVDSLPVQKHR